MCCCHACLLVVESEKYGRIKLPCVLCLLSGHGVGAALNVHEGPQSISTRYWITTPLEVRTQPGARAGDQGHLSQAAAEAWIAGVQHSICQTFPQCETAYPVVVRLCVYACVHPIHQVYPISGSAAVGPLCMTSAAAAAVTTAAAAAAAGWHGVQQ
jgi:hypothetical protein